MSRNFTADQILTDRLVINDTDAFEELYYRYWYSLYFYSLRKLHSAEDSKHIVLTIFSELWQKRRSLPASLPISKYLYEEGVREIIKSLSQKLVSINNQGFIEPVFVTDENAHLEEQRKKSDKNSPELLTQPRKLVRYVNGQAMPAEQRQIQDWPSDTIPNTYLSPKEKRHLEKKILLDIQSHTAYPLFFPKKENPWWQKIAAMF